MKSEECMKLNELNETNEPNLLAKVADAHIHLDQYPQYLVEDLINQWQNNGVDSICAVSTDLASAHTTLQWKQKYPQFIHAAVGYHPEQQPPTDKEMDEIEQLLIQERAMISAIGEVGLPHYTLDKDSRKRSILMLDAFVDCLHTFAEWSRQYELPLLLHAVHDKAKIACDILQQHHVKQAHFHWLKADSTTVHTIVNAGYYISVTPEVTYRERDQQLVRQIPLNQLLLETDGPWPFEGAFKGKQTSPIFIFRSAEKVATLIEMKVDEVLKVCHQNFKNLLKNDH